MRNLHSLLAELLEIHGAPTVFAALASGCEGAADVVDAESIVAEHWHKAAEALRMASGDVYSAETDREDVTLEMAMRVVSDISESEVSS